jgi:pimeloyl-ACP methyl ester carboxylesterase
MTLRFTFLYRFLGILLAMIAVSGCQIVRWQQQSTKRKLGRHGIQSHQLTKDGFNIHFWKGGNGPVVLFLHGFGGDAATTWKEEILALSEHFTVIAPDLLWFGKSSFSGEASLSNQTRAIELLLNEFRADKITVVGQSYGGFIALDFCNKHASRVQQVIFANCPGHTFDYSELEKVSSQFGVNTIDELFVFDQPNQLQRLYDLAAFRSINVPQVLLNQSFELYFKDFPKQKRALITTLQSEKNRFGNNPIKNIPSHVVWGEYDELFSVASGKRFADAIQGKWHILKDCGHAPQLDNRKAFTKLITELVN